MLQQENRAKINHNQEQYLSSSDKFMLNHQNEKNEKNEENIAAQPCIGVDLEYVASSPTTEIIESSKEGLPSVTKGKSIYHACFTVYVSTFSYSDDMLLDLIKHH